MYFSILNMKIPSRLYQKKDQNNYGKIPAL